jgi:hypothetical protein
MAPACEFPVFLLRIQVVANEFTMNFSLREVAAGRPSPETQNWFHDTRNRVLFRFRNKNGSNVSKSLNFDTLARLSPKNEYRQISSLSLRPL